MLKQYNGPFSIHFCCFHRFDKIQLKVVLEYIRNEEFLHPGDTKYYTPYAAFIHPLQTLIFIRFLSQFPKVGTEKLNQRKKQLSVNIHNENTTLNILHRGINPRCLPLTPNSILVARKLLFFLRRIFFFLQKQFFDYSKCTDFFMSYIKTKKCQISPPGGTPQLFKFSTVHHPISFFFLGKIIHVRTSEDADFSPASTLFEKKNL